MVGTQIENEEKGNQGRVNTSKALEAHVRKIHDTTCPTAKFLGDSSVCPVCSVQFSSRARLQAHISETRIRGARLINCGCVIRAGLVKPAGSDCFAKASLADREARKVARKRGMTQPRSEVHAKRLRIGGSLALVASLAKAENI